MKIGIEVETFKHPIRGIGYYTLTLLYALQKYHPLCFHTPKAQINLPFCKHHLFCKKPSLPFIDSLASLLHFRCFDQVDVLHFPEPKILYGKKPKTPFVLTVHDVMPLMFPQFFPKKNTYYMRYFLSKYIKEADAIIAVSQQTKLDLLRFFPVKEEKIHVIGCTLLPKKRTIQKDKKLFFLYVGSFEPRKNLEKIIEGFALFKKKDYPHQLILVGKEEKNCTIPHQTIARLQLQKEIHCKGYMTEEEKMRLFQEAALFIWPSLYEGFGIPLLEAMASGTPIITSKGFALKELTQEAAIHVDPQSPEEIRDAMIALISSPTLSQNLIDKGLERAKDFNMTTFTSSLLAVYKKVL